MPRQFDGSSLIECLNSKKNYVIFPAVESDFKDSEVEELKTGVSKRITIIKDMVDKIKQAADLACESKIPTTNMKI